MDVSSVKQLQDDIDMQRRRKRSMRDDEMVYNNRCDSDKQSYYTQKKRMSLGPLAHGRPSIHSIARQPNSDDQDDETLIRETQAALKSLSGSWPDSRGAFYKINEQEDNSTFQNLFDTQNNFNNNNNTDVGYMRKMSPTITTSTAQLAHDTMMSNNYTMTKVKCEIKSSQKYRRDKDDYANMKFRPDTMKYYSQYPSHDFTELVDDASNDLQIGGAMVNGAKDTIGPPIIDDKYKDLYKSNDLYGNYANHHLHHHRGIVVPYSQGSAFRPPVDNKRSINLPMPSMANSYMSADGVGAGIGSAGGGGYMSYNTDITSILPDNDHGKVKKTIVKDEELAKPVDSPDSKQYTILQPAGVGSKAASVMQDIAREGVVSVAAVSSTSSPGLHNVTSANIAEKLTYDRPPPPPPPMPAYSPGSHSKGSLCIKINQQHPSSVSCVLCVCACAGTRNRSALPVITAFVVSSMLQFL